LTPDGTDVLVIGSGIAGLTFALKVADRAHVTLVTKKRRGHAESICRGGIIDGWIRKLPEGRSVVDAERRDAMAEHHEEHLSVRRQLHVDRLHPYQANPEYRRTRTVESLGMVYQCHYPMRSMMSARGAKRSALHDRLKARGAYFRDVSGWEGADWYSLDGSPPVERVQTLIMNHDATLAHHSIKTMAAVDRKGDAGLLVYKEEKDSSS
jgi:glycine/D-amino acid oxidase-like deaminating enzyme